MKWGWKVDWLCMAMGWGNFVSKSLVSQYRCKQIEKNLFKMKYLVKLNVCKIITNCNCKTIQNVIGESDKICKQKSIYPFSIAASASTAGAGVRPSCLGVKVGSHHGRVASLSRRHIKKDTRWQSHLLTLLPIRPQCSSASSFRRRRTCWEPMQTQREHADLTQS